MAQDEILIILKGRKERITAKDVSKILDIRIENATRGLKKLARWYPQIEVKTIKSTPKSWVRTYKITQVEEKDAIRNQ